MLRRQVGGAALAVMLLAATACGDDDDASDASDELDTEQVAELLGPADEASGEPVRIGMVSEGATAAFDNTDELRAAEATAQFWNTHRGGVGGRPIEVVTCETGADPATATNCANELVQDEVVAVALSQTGVTESLWEPLHASGIPTFFLQASGQEVLLDPESSFVIINPLAGLFGLPIEVAESEGADQVTFVIIDLPQARQGLEVLGPGVMGNAGLEHEIVAIPQGTADMTSQMQQVANSGTGVVHVIGNDAFCTAAFNGLAAAAYEGAITSIPQCITEATREGVPTEALEGMQLTATAALGADDDPTYQLYQAAMSTFGEDVEDVENFTAMGGYAAMASLLTALEEISGDITPETVIETIKAMPEAEVPGGGGVTFRCDGTATDLAPAVCSNEWLRTELDADGEPTTYEVVDASEITP